jgi:hypothetical protein
MRVAPLLADFMAVSRRHHLFFPQEFGPLVKTVVMCEGLAAVSGTLRPLRCCLLLAKFPQSTFPPGLDT